jgi:hypothetical protein
MKHLPSALFIAALALPAIAATPPVKSTPDDSGFDQAAAAIGVSNETYQTHLSSSSIKTAPNDNTDDVMQNGVQTSTS